MSSLVFPWRDARRYRDVEYKKDIKKGPVLAFREGESSTKMVGVEMIQTVDKILDGYG